MKLDFLDRFDFFTGVPDSLLSPVCSYLMDKYGIDGKHHIIAANEGNAVALAAGYYMSTKNVPVVYLQNSGLGNILNPVVSLMNDNVYGIPCVFLVGWRGEPGVHDEPQHVFQGEVTIKLLEDMNIKTFVIDKNTTQEYVKDAIEQSAQLFENGKQIAFVVKKGALEYSGNTVYKNDNQLKREEIINEIVKTSGDDIIISTTGKASRELFEIRERNADGHNKDFLTVGSMGHSSSIALEVALQNRNRKVWCIDGDGAVLMHMGAMAVIGANKPDNLVHVVVNNGAHESVGGMPTVAGDIGIAAIARACGYPSAVTVDDLNGLLSALNKAKREKVLSLIEVKTAIGARDDLGRPTTTAKENIQSFIGYIQNDS